MNCQTFDFCLSVFCIVKLWTREVSVNHATISILNLRLLRLSLLKGAVPTVLSSLSAPSLLSYAPRSLNPHLCFSDSSHLICFPAPAVLSLACPCSLLLTCSCQSSWNKVQPLTPPAVSCFLGTACLFSSWPHLPVDQVLSFCFFFLQDHHHKLIRKKQETVEIRRSYASSEYIQNTWNTTLYSHLPTRSAGQAAGKAAESSDP